MNTPTSSANKKISNGIMRFIIASVGIPFTVLLYYFSFYNFLLAKSIFTIFIALMALEIHQMLPKEAQINTFLSILAGLLFPVQKLIQEYIPQLQLTSINMIQFTLPIMIILLSIYIVFQKNNDIHIWKKILALLFISIYPGLFGSFYIDIPSLGHGVIHFALLTGLVYSNDGLAYLMGRFFGKKVYVQKQPLIAVSPNKTLLGFVSGIVGGIIYFLIVYAISNTQFPGGVIKGISFAIILCIFSILGDAFESAIKRFLNKKNSGVLMLGRGGVLDNFDSLLFTTFTYYFIYPFMY